MSNQLAIQYGPMEAMPLPVELPEHQVSMCVTYRDAIKMCMDNSVIPFTRSKWAEKLGMSEGSLSNILNWDKKKKSKARKRSLDPDLFDFIQRTAGNKAISQFFELQARGALRSQQSTANRKQELLAELAELENQEATA